MPDTDFNLDKTVGQTMTISTYQIDNVLKAYNRQSKESAKPVPAQDAPKAGSRYADVVSLSSDREKPEVYDKISYSLMDVILKGNKSK